MILCKKRAIIQVRIKSIFMLLKETQQSSSKNISKQTRCQVTKLGIIILFNERTLRQVIILSNLLLCKEHNNIL